MSIFTRIIMFILCLSSVSFGEQKKIYGHIQPFPEDKLERPIYLLGYCSLVSIQEMVGITELQLDKNKLNKICDTVIKYFPNKMHERPFKWQISLLPEGSCYRCLNDTEYRFSDRQDQDTVDAYTSRTYQYTFLPNKHKNFYSYFAHELYHALSMFYHVYDPKTNEAKAQKFTKDLGLDQ